MLRYYDNGYDNDYSDYVPNKREVVGFNPVRPTVAPGDYYVPGFSCDDDEEWYYEKKKKKKKKKKKNKVKNKNKKLIALIESLLQQCEDKSERVKERGEG